MSRLSISSCHSLAPSVRRLLPWGAAVVLLGSIGGNAPVPVAAQSELTVCASGCEHTSVQAAVDAAAEGDIIKIATGTYTGVSSRNGTTQVVYISKSVTLRGGYNATFTARDPELYPTTLDAGGLGRVLYVTGPINVTVDGLRLLHGHASLTGGGIYSQNANLRALKSRVADSSVRGGSDGDYGYGAGIYVTGGSFSAQDCVIQDNRHLTDVSGGSCAGGGLYATGSTIDLRNSQLISNRATPATGVWGTAGTGGGAHLETCVSVIEGVTFRGNASGTVNGGGGGLYARFGSLQLADSIFDANQYGGATLYVEGVQVTGNTITGTTGPGLTISNWVSNPVRNVLIARNTIRDSSGLGLSVAKVAESLVIEHNTLTANQGGGLSLTAKSDTGLATAVVVRNNLFQSNTTTQIGGGAYLVGAVDVLFNRFIDNHANQQGGGIYQAETSRNDNASAVYNGNYFSGNSAAEGGALYLHPHYSVNLNISYRNMALVNNTATTSGSGIYYYVYAKTVRTFTHLTFSGNHGGDGSAIYVLMGKSTWSHSIIANSPVGLGVNSSYGVTFDHVLRHNVDSPIVGGTIADNSPLTGDPAFKSDGYHISSTSAAIDAASGSGVIDDVDNNPRPMGMAPDVGADESGYSLSENGVQATKLAAAPEWRVYYTGVNAPPSTRLEQTYMIPFGHYGTTDAPAVASFAITDDIPSALTPTAINNPMDLDYSVSGSTSTWRSRESLAPGNWGWVGVTSVSDSATGGQTLTNTGQFAYTLANGASHAIPLTATTTVPVRPVYPPVLFSPLDGEMCLDPGGQLTATGMAGAGMTVRLYEDDVLKGEGVASPTTGEFTITWTTALSSSKSIVVHTQACDSGGTCSVTSRDVRLTYPAADWCAQRSYWEGDVSGRHFRFYFRDERGRYATNDFVIPGVYGFWNTKVHLYSCCEHNEVNPFTVKADGVSYQSPSAHDGRWWTFEIGAAHNVTVESQCHAAGGTAGARKIVGGEVLIDPDGFVFDSTQGGAYDAQTETFTPVRALADMTVTAYMYVPEWGTWTPWPAHKYGQINPQVTGSDGYFAFFTPPGKYYLNVDAGNSFQSWRSPVVTVVDKLVHVNVPLTPTPPGTPRTVALTLDGPQPAILPVALGASVEWISTLRDDASAAELKTYSNDPVLQPRSSDPLDPLTNPLGFDGGMLAPGRSFLRRFETPGDYAYSDGRGHAGTIRVSATAQVTPVITWPPPAPIVAGTPLGSSQLNATAAAGGSPVAGSFQYTPAAGTVLAAGTHALTTVFTPTDAVTYATATATVSLSVTAAPPAIRLSPGALRFGGTNTNGTLSPVTPPQTVTVDFSAPAALTWTASASHPWVQITNGAGTGSGTFTVTIVNPDNVLAGVSQAAATLTVTSAGASNSPQTVTVDLSLRSAGTTTAPFGQVDTPVQGATEVVGAIGVSGWALDDLAVTSVKIYRNCLPIDTPAACFTRHGFSMVFVGDAAFVAGARPDVEAAFPTAPQAYRGGWGYLMLTNMLPHVTNSLAYGGQGPLTLYAIATDVEGQTTLLGRSQANSTPTTITMANDTIAKPFGAIDTPAQGETVSGVLANFGWVLTRDTNNTAGADDIVMPTDGSTMTVVVDGVAVGKVSYNQCRGTVGNPVTGGRYCDDDVANIFGNAVPQPTFTARTANATPYRNLDADRAAIGSFAIDTTLLSNGMHNIAWGVTDSAGRVEGIGSRNFFVLNAGSDAGADVGAGGFDVGAGGFDVGAGFSRPQTAVRLKPDATAIAAALLAAPPTVYGAAAELHRMPVVTIGILGRTGFDFDAPLEIVPADADGVHLVQLAELGRLELVLGPVDRGFLVANGTLRDLPMGSHLNAAAGVFTWMPGPGYFGTYRLAFVRGEEQVLVDVTVRPERPAAAGEGEVRMHIDTPTSGDAVAGRFVVAGWALDPQAAFGSGIGAVHVWAQRRDVPTAAAEFLGEATLGGVRPDVAAAFGRQFGTAAYGLTTAPLAAGVYDVTVHVRCVRTGRWEDARTVTVTVR